MPTDKKRKLVEELKERLSRCTIAVTVNYTGLSVNTITGLRQRLRERGIEYKVIKNTLAYIAADAAGRPEAKSIIEGPTAVAFGYGDPLEVARALDEYIKATRSPLAIRGAVLDGQVLSPAEVSTLATLPPRAELVARLLGQMQMPVVRLVGTLHAPLIRLVSTLSAPLGALVTLLKGRLQQLQEGV